MPLLGVCGLPTDVLYDDLGSGPRVDQKGALSLPAPSVAAGGVAPSVGAAAYVF